MFTLTLSMTIYLLLLLIYYYYLSIITTTLLLLLYYHYSLTIVNHSTITLSASSFLSLAENFNDRHY